MPHSNSNDLHFCICSGVKSVNRKKVQPWCWCNAVQKLKLEEWLVSDAPVSFLLVINTFIVGAVSKCYLTLSKRLGTPCTGCQTITGLTQRQTTIHTDSHTYRQSPILEETGATRCSPRTHRDNSSQKGPMTLVVSQCYFTTAACVCETRSNSARNLEVITI